MMAAVPEPFHRLDSLIAAQPQMVAEKEARLEQMKADVVRMKAPVDRYTVLSRLFEEYAAYQYDSAYTYVTECLEIATQLGDDRLINDSRLNLAHILSTACLMEQARQTLAQIDTTRLTPDQFIRYYRTRTDLLIYQAEFMQGTRLQEI